MRKRNRINELQEYWIISKKFKTISILKGIGSKRFEKHQPTGKYIVYFKGQAKKIGPIKLTDKKKAPYSTRYTTINKILKAKTINEVF